MLSTQEVTATQDVKFATSHLAEHRPALGSRHIRLQRPIVQSVSLCSFWNMILPEGDKPTYLAILGQKIWAARKPFCSSIVDLGAENGHGVCQASGHVRNNISRRAWRGEQLRPLGSYPHAVDTENREKRFRNGGFGIVPVLVLSRGLHRSPSGVVTNSFADLVNEAKVEVECVFVKVGCFLAG